jgi:hypothetical protein
VSAKVEQIEDCVSYEKDIDKLTALDTLDNAYPSFEDSQTVRLNQISTILYHWHQCILSDDAPLAKARVSAGAKL